MKGLYRFTKIDRNEIIEDIDFYEFYGMMEQGLTHREIAGQLGITDKMVDKLAKEMNKGL